jgi:diguanylate cyclase (GGDEF)-like protein
VKERHRARAGAAATDGASQVARTRILVVEDDPAGRRTIAVALACQGHEVETAENGRVALARAMDFGPEIVISDWAMPEADGLELTRALRASQVGQRIHVILLTGAAQEDRLIEAYEKGVDECLRLPVDPRVLAARVRGAERLIQMRQQVEELLHDRERQLAQLGVLTRKLQVAARTDPLTDLGNRRFAMERLEAEHHRLQRSGGTFSIVLIDIDRFKSVNDGYGHEVGDLVLKEVAGLLRRIARKSDSVCRLGGEEFLVICPGANLAQAAAAAERLRAACEAHVVRSGSFDGGVTLSLGVAQMADPSTSVDALLRQADGRVYAAKGQGRNRVVDRDPVPEGLRAAG